MKPHELDVVSLVAGLLFVVLGAVGLLQGTGVVDNGAAWALIGGLAAVGAAGVAASARRLVAGRPGDKGPLMGAVPEPPAVHWSTDEAPASEDPQPADLADGGENPA